jgi:hypothetical protein
VFGAAGKNIPFPEYWGSPVEYPDHCEKHAAIELLNQDILVP